MKKIAPYTPLPFPEYAYIPGKNERHSIREVIAPLPVQCLSTTAVDQNCLFLYGIDLFNHHFYWEAHEAWELVWHKEKNPDRRLFIQGLIQITAGFVKAMQGNPTATLEVWGRAVQKCSVVTAHEVGVDYRALIQEIQIALFHATLVEQVEKFHHPIRLKSPIQ